MRREYLGDALDHWKGSLFESLTQSGILRNFAVDPMAKDWADWQPDDVLAFTHLLRIDKSQLISHKAEFSLLNRQKYFAEMSHTDDLFLDPDTGIATGKVGDKSKYVTPQEIKFLLGKSDRLIAVYQHTSRKTISKRVDEVCGAVHGAINEIQWASYESPTVAMIFLSHSYARIADVTKHFRCLLGQHAAQKRIRTSICAV